MGKNDEKRSIYDRFIGLCYQVRGANLNDINEDGQSKTWTITDGVSP